MTKNYHNHTYRCFHASGEDEEYVFAAIENGFNVLGFSDHCAWHFDDESFVSGMRMGEDQIEDYVQSVNRLRERFKSKIEILLGWEVEYFPKYLPWMKNTLRENSFDYIILGHHFAGDENGGPYNGMLKKKKDVLKYGRDVCEALETGLFTYVAHPDLFMRGYGVFDETAAEVSESIIQKSIETGTPLEYNLLGFEYGLYDGVTGYPFPAFWQMAARMGASAVLGLDAHSPEKYANKKLISLGEMNLREYGIDVISEPELRRSW